MEIMDFMVEETCRWREVKEVHIEATCLMLYNYPNVEIQDAMAQHGHGRSSSECNSILTCMASSERRIARITHVAWLMDEATRDFNQREEV